VMNFALQASAKHSTPARPGGPMPLHGSGVQNLLERPRVKSEVCDFRRSLAAKEFCADVAGVLIAGNGLVVHLRLERGPAHRATLVSVAGRGAPWSRPVRATAKGRK